MRLMAGWPQRGNKEIAIMQVVKQDIESGNTYASAH